MEITNLLTAVKRMKKLLREQKKELKVIDQYYLDILMEQKSVFTPPTEVKDIQVEESPDGVPTQPGEPDLDLIAEQEAENTEVNPTGL